MLKKKVVNLVKYPSFNVPRNVPCSNHVLLNDLKRLLSPQLNVLNVFFCFFTNCLTCRWARPCWNLNLATAAGQEGKHFDTVQDPDLTIWATDSLYSNGTCILNRCLWSVWHKFLKFWGSTFWGPTRHGEPFSIPSLELRKAYLWVINNDYYDTSSMVTSIMWQLWLHGLCPSCGK